MTNGLEVITGPMFSGKSEELLRRLRRAQIAGLSVKLFKPDIDNRYSDKDVVSHNGSSMPSISLRPNFGGVKAIGEYYNSVDVIGIDEAQFFDGYIASQLQKMSKGTLIIVAGLDMDFRRLPFGPMPNLLAMAERVQKLTAVCNSCGIDGEPAKYGGKTVMVGGTETYEARCRNCFQISH
jgi:thymidine kinase